MAAAQGDAFLVIDDEMNENDIDPAQEDAFLVIDDEMNENDIDPDSMEEMEKNGTVSNLLEDLLSQNR